VGDADDGSVGHFDGDRNPGDVPAWLGVLAERPDLLAGRDPPPAAWILGEASRVASMANTSRPTRNLPRGLSWPEGGYAAYSWAEGQPAWLMMDAGPLGYLALAAHGHADALSVWLRHGDEWVWTESGTYLYHEDWQWRQYFRGTAAHNTMVVAGHDQSDQRGPTIWGRRAGARFGRVTWGDGGAVFEGEHDGYRRLSPQAMHRRTVAVLPGLGVLVVDRLISRGGHPVALHWHLGQGEAAAQSGALTWRGASTIWSCRSTLGDPAR
jgi:hypothetical protein